MKQLFNLSHMKDPSLAAQLVSLPTLFIVTLVGILTYTLFAIQKQKSDAVVMELAGRQRVLIQRDLSEVLLISQGSNPEHKVTRSMLQETLKALIHGGPALLNRGSGEIFQLPPAPTAEIKKTLEEQKNLLGIYIKRADEFLGIQRGAPTWAAKFQELLGLHTVFIEVADESVKLLRDHSRSKIADTLKWEAAIGLVVGILVILLTRRLLMANRRVHSEIAERARAEGDLRKSEERFDLAVKGSNDGIWDWDILTNRAYYSPRFQELLGFSKNELDPLFQSFESLLHPSDQPRVLDAIQAHLHRNRPYDIECQLRTKSGTHRWFHVRGQAIWNQQEEAIRMVGSLRDITQRKQEQEELEVAKHAAEEANDAKSQFLANMSHELRTPLNAIIGYSEMLQEDASQNGDKDIIPDLKKINASGKHLLELINELLDLSKIEAGKMEVHPEEFTVSHMVHDVATMVQPLVDQNTNTLQVDCAPDLGTMYTDPTKIRQCLFNLLSNACKFTNDGKIHLRVVREIKSSLEWITFEIKDTGIGMTSQQIEKIFDVFSQADSSTTRKYGGTGLGLTITKKICQLLAGDIAVTSTVGKGSTFVMTLPVSLPSPDIQPPSSTPDPLSLKKQP